MFRNNREALSVLVLEAQSINRRLEAMTKAVDDLNAVVSALNTAVSDAVADKGVTNDDSTAIEAAVATLTTITSTLTAAFPAKAAATAATVTTLAT